MNKLLHKYLYGLLSGEEARQLKQWINTASASEIENAISSQWLTHTAKESRNQEAYKTVSDKLRPILEHAAASRRHRIIHYITRIAAILLLPLCLATGVYFLTQRHHNELYAATQYKIETGKGERATLILPDGTKVSLNSESSFTYPASFGKTSRSVQLEGEGYFEVTHDETLPFLVQTRQTNIKVLGTIFNVHAYPDDNWVETALVEGKVEFCDTNNPHNRVTLAPNQTVRFNLQDGTFERNIVEQRLATAWKRGEIIFRSASWPFIIDQISNYYGVTIQQVGESIPKEQFTGSFLQEDVNNILRNLQAHYHFSYTKSGNLIRIEFN